MRQGYGEVAGDTGLIVQRQFVAFDRDAPEGGLNPRGQCRHEVLPSRDQRLARQDQFLGESIQFDEIDHGLFEQRIPGPESLGVAHEQRQIARDGLGQEQVQESPSPLGRSLH